MSNEELILIAIDAMDRAYSPYSNFRVGAALLCENDIVYTGCNIENASFSATNCAERTAFFKAIEKGERSFKKIAVVGGNNGIINEYIPPCGVCLQVMSEFCNPDLKIILAKNEEDYIETSLRQLLPQSFTNKNMGESYE